MDKEVLAKADKEVLVEIVKYSQKQGLKGARGGWKDFLNSYDKKFGHSLSDPSRRSPDVLIAFLNTFFGEEQKIFLNILRRHRDHVRIMKSMQRSRNNDDPFQRLVLLTHEHPRYLARYSFPSQNEDWVVIPLGEISKTKKLADVIAIDCEMVLCQDGTEAVVQVCAVDKNLEVKLNLLVKPDDPVVDYRTDITGIVAKDLEDVTTSLADAQESLKKLLVHGAALVGHSLHNDLLALKVDHPLVIDTTHIFEFADTTVSTPSLNNLCKSVLGYKIRKDGEPHNCVMDAQAAMKLVLAKIEYGFENPIVVERESLGTEKLLLHRIPVGVSSSELLKLFSPKFDAKIQADLKISGQFFSTFAVFKDSSVADEAFLGIHGLCEKDSFGRPQKFVTLQLSTGKKVDFYICRMAAFCLPNNYIGRQKDSPKKETDFVDNIKMDAGETNDASFEGGKIHWIGEKKDKKINDSVVDDVNEEFKAAGKRNADDVIPSIEGTAHAHTEESIEEKTRKKSRYDNVKKELKASKSHSFGDLKTADGGRAGDGEVLCSCTHFEQIDRLKQEIRERDDEIYNLQRILYEYIARDLK